MNREHGIYGDQMQRIDAILHKYGLSAPGYGGEVFGSTHETAADLMCGAEIEEIGDDEHERNLVLAGRLQGWRAFIHLLTSDGMHPLLVVRNFYAAIKATRPELLHDMSMEDIAVLCGDGGRATVSARIKRVYNKRLAEVGDNGRAPCQKSGAASLVYASAQKRNRNRREGARKAAQARRLKISNKRKLK